MDRETRKHLAALANTTNPNTLTYRTDKELADQFCIHPGSVARIRREFGVFRRPRPKVITGQTLSDHERAFYVGMALSAYDIETFHWGPVTEEPHFVRIGTESADPRFSRLLEMTIAKLGETVQWSGYFGVYLDYQTFAFMLDPVQNLTPNFFGGRSRIASMLLPLIGIRMSPKDHRLTLRRTKDQATLESQNQALIRINKQFKRHRFISGDDGEPLTLGRIERRNDINSLALVVRRPLSVMEALLEERGVRRLLKFMNRIKAWDEDYDKQPSIPNSSPNGSVTLQDIMRSFVPDALEFQAERQRLAAVARSWLAD